MEAHSVLYFVSINCNFVIAFCRTLLLQNFKQAVEGFNLWLSGFFQELICKKKKKSLFQITEKLIVQICSWSRCVSVINCSSSWLQGWWTNSNKTTWSTGVPLGLSQRGACLISNAFIPICFCQEMETSSVDRHTVFWILLQPSWTATYELSSSSSKCFEWDVYLNRTF